MGGGRSGPPADHGRPVVRAVDAEPLRAARARPAGRTGLQPLHSQDRRVVASRRTATADPDPDVPRLPLPSSRLDKHSDTEVRKARGLMAILGESWTCRAVVPDEDIAAIQRLLHSGLPARPHPYLREGQRVRITRGPMADVEGILVRSNSRKGLLVISVALLRRSVAVEVDCTMVTAA